MLSTLSRTDLLSMQIYRPNYFVAERELAWFLGQCIKHRHKKVPPLTDTLLYKQPEAVAAACENSVSILTGPPGTGKTTTLRKIVDSFVAAGMRGIIIAPTGKAAVRVDEVVNTNRDFTSKVKCSTVHSALQWSSIERAFSYNRFRRFPYDYVIIEEFSMLDIELARDVLEAIAPQRTRLVFCGDQYQLPSVGPGNVSRDLINCGRIPSTELDKVLRTGENSGITYNANLMLRGLDTTNNDPETNLPYKDFFMVGKQKELDTAEAITKWASEDIPTRRNLKPEDIQVLCAGKDGVTGTKNLNRMLRDAINKTNGNGFQGFKVGDRVINNKNLRQLSIVNGSVGMVRDVIVGQSGGHIVVDFGRGSGPKLDGIVEFKTTETISLAFALTVHKCQGSEFPVVIMPLHRSHMRLMTRPLIYTGLTRGKSLGVLVGDYEVLRYAIKNLSDTQRASKLSELIRLATPINTAA